MTVPFFSSDSMRVSAFGEEVRREEKVPAIAHDPLVRKHLRVCWKNRDGLVNCSRCGKCLMTMVSLAEAGVLNEFAVFDDEEALITRLNETIEREYIATLNQRNAEYRALQSQIQPHFLYNTLNGFIGLNRLGERKTLEKAILALSGLLRSEVASVGIVISKREPVSPAAEVFFDLAISPEVSAQWQDMLGGKGAKNPAGAELAAGELPDRDGRGSGAGGVAVGDRPEHIGEEKRCARLNRNTHRSRRCLGARN